jgi:hypothetical protein
LLEHVPEPKVLLDQVRHGLRPGGIAYLTGAVNAPQPDHISLFRSPEELTALVEGQGLQINRKLVVCPPKRKGRLNPPMVVAMVVESAS